MRKRWLVDLTDAERVELESVTKRRRAPARKVAHARVLLLTADGLTDDEIAAATGTSRSPVERTRKRLRAERAGGGAVGQATVRQRTHARGSRPSDVIALACANPPQGRTCWTMQLLANELVVRQVVPSISDETVRRELKNTGSSRGSRSTGASRRSARVS